MDRVLKLVYDNWIREVPLANGAPQKMITGIRDDLSIYTTTEDIKRNAGRIFEKNNCAFRFHNNFFLFFKKYFSSSQIVNSVGDDHALYLYPVEVRSIASLSAKHATIINGEVIYYTFLDTIHPETLKHIASGRVKILVNYIHDPVNSHDEFEALEDYLAEHGIDGNNVVVVCGNSLDDLPNKTVKIVKGNLFLREAAEDLKKFPSISSLGYVSDNVKPSDLDQSRIRNKRFICFNRNISNREHRAAIAYMALKYNLLDDGVFSFIDNKLSIRSLSEYVNKFLPDVDQTLIDKIKEMLPYEIDTQHLPSGQKTGFSTNNNKKEWYEETYIHLVSETRFLKGEHPFISEKTFRPILNLQPFLMFGNHNSLAEIRSYGFKTFSPWIDESYDEEVDPSRRMVLLEQELKRLAEMSKQELHDLYYDMQDILIHNQTHLATFIDFNPYQIVFDKLQEFYREN